MAARKVPPSDFPEPAPTAPPRIYPEIDDVSLLDHPPPPYPQPVPHAAPQAPTDSRTASEIGPAARTRSRRGRSPEGSGAGPDLPLRAYGPAPAPGELIPLQYWPFSSADMARNPQISLLQYVDDLLLVASTQELCLDGTRKLLKELGELGYWVSAKKAQLCRSEVTYLGYTLREGKRWLTEARKKTVMQIPTPTTLRQVQSIVRQPPDRWMTNARMTHYQSLLLNDQITFAPPAILNPATLLPEAEDSTPVLRCIDVLDEETGTRKDLTDQPWPSVPNWYTDSSSFVVEGKRRAGAEVVDGKQDKMTPSGLTDPSDINSISPKDAQRVRLSCTSTWKLKGICQVDSQFLTKGRQRPSSTRQCNQQIGTMSPKHVVKFRKRKSQGEGGRDQKCEEPHESPKRVKQELYEKEPAHQESGNRQAMNPMAKGPLHPNKQDRVRDPEEEDVIEVKYVGAGKSRKRTYSNIQDRVEKQHNEKCRRLSDHLQPCDPVHSGPPSTHTRPADNLKNIKGCMEEHIHGCETTQFQPNQFRHPVRRHHSPVTIEKSYSPETHFETKKTGGINFENKRTRHHPQPDILGGAQAPNSKNSDTSGIFHKNKLTPEAEEEPFEEQEKGSSQDHGPDCL
ncbi:hypothetical protein NN561_007111 [Cricetulus griseus]